MQMQMHIVCTSHISNLSRFTRIPNIAYTEQIWLVPADSIYAKLTVVDHVYFLQLLLELLFLMKLHLLTIFALLNRVAAYTLVLFILIGRKIL